MIGSHTVLHLNKDQFISRFQSYVESYLLYGVATIGQIQGYSVEVFFVILFCLSPLDFIVGAVG